jgi:hypothetical protein
MPECGGILSMPACAGVGRSQNPFSKRSSEGEPFRWVERRQGSRYRTPSPTARVEVNPQPFIR